MVSSSILRVLFLASSTPYRSGSARQLTSVCSSVTHNEVLSFWFEELSPKDWYKKSDELDATIRERFGEVHERASASELDSWRTDAKGALAEIIVLDQFSRNMYRDSPRAFAQDALSVALSQQAISKGFDKELKPTELAFLFMPLMHSESSAIHDRAMELFSAPGLEKSLRFEERHKEIIDRFGRYPHRNQVLGRESTAEEEAFLKEPGSSF
jgi:uncharacterized protein (DUF924 family)